MITAIILMTAIVIAVTLLVILRNSSEISRIEESTEWARKWNEQWGCGNNCKACNETQFCKLKDEV